MRVGGEESPGISVNRQVVGEIFVGIQRGVSFVTGGCQFAGRISEQPRGREFRGIEPSRVTVGIADLPRVGIGGCEIVIVHLLIGRAMDRVG